jgi:uncharacterized protein (TIGR03435 family)
MFARKMNLTQSLILLLAASVPVANPPAFAQQAAPPAAADAPYVPTMTFDVASVRQSPPADSYSVGGWFMPNTTTLRANNWSIHNLISAAYGGLKFYQIDSNGIPQDVLRALYIIQAKGDPATEETIAKLPIKQQQAEQAHMILALLQERFKLKAHFETRQGDVYNLVAPKGEAKLRSATRPPPTAEETKIWGDRTLYQRGSSRTEFDYVAHDCQMSDIVEMLASQFGHPVIDKTGFTGKYNFILKTHDTKQSDRKDDDTNPIPTLEEAIQELGLKLEPAKGPTQVLIIDHIEKPTDN